MIGKTSRAVAMKYARPTTPRTANTDKDTFSTVMPSFGISNSTPVELTFSSAVPMRVAARGYNYPFVSNPVCDAYHKCGGHPQ